jgi:hypothetical protein
MLTEGARKIYHGRRVGLGRPRLSLAEVYILSNSFPSSINIHVSVKVFQSCEPI